jgi:Fe-S cluster assembly protein SufD
VIGASTLTASDLTVGGGARALETMSGSLGEPAWRLEQRRAAWKAFEELPDPDPKADEDWRRTSLRGLKLRERPVAAEGILAVTGFGEQARESGAIVCSLLEAACRHEELVKPHIYAALPPTSGKLVAAAQALAQNGLFIHVPDGVELTEPLVLRHEITGPEQGFGSYRHIVVSLGRNARAQVIVLDESPADEREGLFLSAVEVLLGDGASLRYTAVQALGSGVMRFETRRAVVGRDANIEWTDCELGGRTARVELETHLGEPGAGVTAAALVFGDGSQHVDLLNRARHVAPHTTSDLEGIVALKDASRSVYRGIVIMENGCAGANSSQGCSSVLLSENARSDAIPSLFIDEDDVKAGHGATSGPLDERQIYYMMTRGIPREQCERLILEGFFAPVLERLEGTPAEDELRKLINRKLAGIGGGAS